MIKKMNKKGFTLIELLVVIAIIGILSGTVIVSMSGAQDSAKDARIQSGMSQLRSVAEIYLLTNNTYGDGTTNFTTSGDGLALKTDIEANSTETMTVNQDASNYCMSVPLSTGVLCMDSKGKVGSVACGSATDCP